MTSTANRLLLMLMPMLIWVAHFLLLYLGALWVCTKLPAEQHTPALLGGGGAATLLALGGLWWAARRLTGSDASRAPTDRWLTRVAGVVNWLGIAAIVLSALMLAQTVACG
jgi:hypothetical protein